MGLQNPSGVYMNSGPSTTDWLGAGLAGLGGAASNVSGGNSTTTGSGTSSSTGTYSTGATGSSMPQYDEKTLDYRNGLLDYLHKYLTTDPDLSGYHAQGLAQINNDSQNSQMGIGQQLAARGLSGSGVDANAMIQGNNQRMASSSQFSNSIPMVAEQLRQQRLAQTMGFFSGLPVGQSSINTGTGTQSQNGSTTSNSTTTVKKSPWDILGGLAGGLGGALSTFL